MSKLLDMAAERAARYLDGLDERRVAPLPEDVARLSQLGGPMPDNPTDPEEVLALLDEIGSPATVASAGGRYFGFVVGGSLPATVAADWLATAWDQNAGLFALSPTAAAIEEIVRGWLLDVLRLPAEANCGFVTGATMANFTCLAAARHKVLKDTGWDVERDGLFGAPAVTVVVGDEVHVSLIKALGMLGFGRERVVRVPVDGQGRMRADALPAISGPTIVCTQAGNVNTGAFDPVGEVCELVKGSGAWVHVDGAFGLLAAASPSTAYLSEGVEKADSWGLDLHKWLNVPYDSGLAFVRDSEALIAAMSATAAYLLQSEQRDPDNYTPEMSRRARGVDIWAALRSLGRSGLADLIERNCRHAAHFAEELSAAGYEILNEVRFNQVLVSFGDDRTTQQVIKGIQEDGTCWCGGTLWHGRAAMRISVSSWATGEADVERSLAAMLRVAGEVTSREPTGAV